MVFKTKKVKNIVENRGNRQSRDYGHLKTKALQNILIIKVLMTRSIVKRDNLQNKTIQAGQNDIFAVNIDNCGMNLMTKSLLMLVRVLITKSMA